VVVMITMAKETNATVTPQPLGFEIPRCIFLDV
jgi:hypothetical protein